MSRYTNLAYTEVLNRMIYALVSPKEKKVYIGQVTERLVRDAYSKHYRLENEKTKDMVQELKEDSVRPCFFVLEKVRETKVKTYYLEIVWARIFLDLGYEVLDKSLVSYANDLNEENKIKYEERKVRFDFDKVCTCDKCVIKEYGRKVCANDKYKNSGEVIDDEKNN